MSEEFNIVDEKTPEEKKAENFAKHIEHIIDTERRDLLVKEELADIDALIGVLFQVRGALQKMSELADDVEEYLDDLTTVTTAMLKMLNENATKKKRVKKNE